MAQKSQTDKEKDDYFSCDSGIGAIQIRMNLEQVCYSITKNVVDNIIPLHISLVAIAQKYTVSASSRRVRARNWNI